MNCSCRDERSQPQAPSSSIQVLANTITVISVSSIQLPVGCRWTFALRKTPWCELSAAIDREPALYCPVPRLCFQQRLLVVIDHLLGERRAGRRTRSLDGELAGPYRERVFNGGLRQDPPWCDSDQNRPAKKCKGTTATVVHPRIRLNASMAIKRRRESSSTQQIAGVLKKIP
jgi:hypothetical protein